MYARTHNTVLDQLKKQLNEERGLGADAHNFHKDATEEELTVWKSAVHSKISPDPAKRRGVVLEFVANMWKPTTSESAAWAVYAVRIQRCSSMYLQLAHA